MMRRFWILPALSLALLAASTLPSFAEDDDSGTGYPRVVAVFFTKSGNADCAALEKGWLASVRKTYEEKSVLFLTADVSTAGSRNQARMLLTSLQSEATWKKHSGSAGVVVLLDGDMDEKAVLNAKTSPADAAKQFEAALKGGDDADEGDDEGDDEDDEDDEDDGN